MPGVHRPCSDTPLLIAALAREPLRGAAVADICTGSGVVAIAAARLGASRVLAVDISTRATFAARVNSRLNGAAVRVRRGDLLSALAGESVDVITCNPPYLPARTDQLPVRGAARAIDAGCGGRAVLDRVCEEAPRHLRPGGVLLLVHSSLCGVEQTCARLHAHRLEPEVVLRRRGPLGPALRARAAMLRARGLLGEREEEDIVVVRGRSPDAPALARRRSRIALPAG